MPGRLIAPLVVSACLVGMLARLAGAEVVPTNVRPFFGVGYTHPVEFQQFDRGFGMGFGFEIEQSEHVSGIFRFDWDEVRMPVTGGAYFYPDLGRRAFTWSAGARLNMSRGWVLHPYTEALLGARMISDNGRLNVYPMDVSSREETADPNGIAATVRVGFSTASRGGSGFFLDGGYEFSVEHPDLYGLAPIRFGVVFP